MGHGGRPRRGVGSVLAQVSGPSGAPLGPCRGRPGDGRRSVAYTKIRPVDLGPLVRTVEGEKHITLTGWNRSDYSALAAHPDVVVLQMANPDVDDATLDIVARLTNLRELDLTTTKVGDAGLAKLAPLSQLKMLKLRGTSASDAALDGVLTKLPGLMMLDARQTRVSTEGAGRWKQSKPGRKIQR